MAYGHAERNLALVRQLEAQTRQLLESLDRLDPEQSAWLQEVTRPHRPVLPARGWTHDLDRGHRGRAVRGIARSNPPGARDAPGHRGVVGVLSVRP
jgi:hypothetical protein